MKIKINQLEMPLPANPNFRRCRRAFRAKWWFTQMRAVVDSAPEQKPLEISDLDGPRASRTDGSVELAL